MNVLALIELFRNFMNKCWLIGESHKFWDNFAGVKKLFLKCSISQNVNLSENCSKSFQKHSRRHSCKFSLRKNLILVLVVEAFVIDEIFLCDNKKELQNAPQQKKRDRPKLWGKRREGKALKEQKHSWCSELQSFFIFFCDAQTIIYPQSPLSTHSPKCHHHHQQNKEFLHSFFARVQELFHFIFFHSFLSPNAQMCFCLPLAFRFHAANIQKHNQLYENCERFLRAREKKANKQSKEVRCRMLEKLSSTDSSCVWIPSAQFLVPWAHWAIVLVGLLNVLFTQKAVTWKVFKSIELRWAKEGSKEVVVTKCEHYYPFT